MDGRIGGAGLLKVVSIFIPRCRDVEGSVLSRVLRAEEFVNIGR